MNKEKKFSRQDPVGTDAKKTQSLHHTKGIPLSEALRTKGVLDKASRKI
mgnify:CR=1 FL=1